MRKCKKDELKNPNKKCSISLKLTKQQKKQLAECMKESGCQVPLSLEVEVVEDKIAPVAISMGAV